MAACQIVRPAAHPRDACGLQPGEFRLSPHGCVRSISGRERRFSCSQPKSRQSARRRIWGWILGALCSFCAAKSNGNLLTLYVCASRNSLMKVRSGNLCGLTFCDTGAFARRELPSWVKMFSRPIDTRRKNKIGRWSFDVKFANFETGVISQLNLWVKALRLEPYIIQGTHLKHLKWLKIDNFIWVSKGDTFNAVFHQSKYWAGNILLK